MLKFRRAVLVAGCILALFLFFSGPRQKDRLVDLEKRLRENERNSENALKDLQLSTDQRNKHLEESIKELETERKILEMQVQELRRLPDPSASVLEQLKYQYPYRVDMRFPAFVWQTWIHDFLDPEIDPSIRSYMESWRNDRDFVHEVFSDKDAVKLVRFLYRNVPKVIEAYESMPDVILQADFFRYLILFARGGVYSDADTELLKPTPNWLPSWVNPLEIGLVVGIEADPDRPDWHDWFARRVQFCQWTIQSKPGHPVLRELIANITDTTLRRKQLGQLSFSGGKDRGADILDWTGPGIWTDSVFKYFNTPQVNKDGVPVDWHDFTGLTEPKKYGDVLVLPITSFSPGVGHMGSQPISDPLAFVQHHFSGSWKPVNERM